MRVCVCVWWRRLLRRWVPVIEEGRMPWQQLLTSTSRLAVYPQAYCGGEIYSWLHCCQRLQDCNCGRVGVPLRAPQGCVLGNRGRWQSGLTVLGLCVCVCVCVCVCCAEEPERSEELRSLPVFSRLIMKCVCVCDCKLFVCVCYSSTLLAPWFSAEGTAHYLPLRMKHPTSTLRCCTHKWQTYWSIMCVCTCLCGCCACTYEFVGCHTESSGGCNQTGQCNQNEHSLSLIEIKGRVLISQYLIPSTPP